MACDTVKPRAWQGPRSENKYVISITFEVNCKLNFACVEQIALSAIMLLF